MRGATISQTMEPSNFNLTGAMEVLKSPIGRLVQIEFLVCLVVLSLILQESLGAYRRRLKNDALLRGVLFLCYTITPFLVAYTLGLMYAAPFKNEFFLIWALVLIISLGNADSFSAYKLEDNEQWNRKAWQFLFKVVGLILLVAPYSSDAFQPVLRTSFVSLYIIMSVRFLEGSLASFLGSKASLQWETKFFADYMKRELSNSNEDELDLASMNGYTYLVRHDPNGESNMTMSQNLIRSFLGMRIVIKHLEAQAPEYLVPFREGAGNITVESVWQCQRQLLKERDPDHRIKDFCLSFALFRILSMRSAGYFMSREVCLKSWRLFRRIIQKDGYERAFRIIETELAFVFYQFYTKYQVTLNQHNIFYPWLLKVVKLVSIIICFVTVASVSLHYEAPEDNEQLITSNGVNIDVIVAVVVIFMVLILEILQLVLMIFSEWGKVAWISYYVTCELCHRIKRLEKLIGDIGRTELLKPWERKLHQYSLLKSYGYSPALFFYNSLTKMKMIGQKQSTPAEVKSAVINSLPNEGNALTNGRTSLMRNHVGETCLWACNLETQAQVIMVWHIATSICEHEIPTNTQESGTLKKIATNLSKYLAYLVAFAPRLLPDHPCVAEYVFKQVVIEACLYFRECSTMEDRIGKLRGLSREGGQTVIERGAQLGQRLLDLQVPIPQERDRAVWKVLADFWAELMLYVAPSDDTDAHAEHLTMGGEFVTHIWALVTHAGTGRDPASLQDGGE